MITKDRRSTPQRTTHRWAVVGTDKAMSGCGGLGGAAGGASYAAWACRDDDIDTVLQWVEGRSDMTRVRVVDLDDYRPTCAHLSIYVVRNNHPALAGR